MKMVLTIVFVVLGLYWLFGHYNPFPFSHEEFGLQEHNVHDAVGVIFLIFAALVWWKWHPKS